MREANIVAAEDTRVTRKLLSHFEIGTHLVSYHEHSGPVATEALVRRMRDENQSVALVTDAGTPGISDPGAELVRAAIAAGIVVCPIPGAAAPIAALIGSGLPTARFLFEGFLPRTRSTRVAKLKALAAEVRTVICFEAPPRLVETLGEIGDAFGADRRVCVARELTKIHEEFRRGTAVEVAAHYTATPPRGECVIVVEGRDENEDAGVLNETVAEGKGWKELIKLLAKEAGIDRKELYAAIVKLKADRE
jgi:16S rRNA (cytidine1402-2'-O)-methyltransferase